MSPSVTVVAHMKKGRRITKLTVETERTFIFRNRGGSRVASCVRCESEVELMAVADAAMEAGRSELEIYQLIQAGGVHFVEDEGHILVCLTSLRRIQRIDGEQNEQEGESHET